MSKTEVLNKEMGIYDGVADGLVACITYKEDEKEKYLINVCIVDGMLLPVYYITEDKRLFDFESTPLSKLSEEEYKLMDRLEKKARQPESKDEIEMAIMTIEMIKEKCLEQNLMSEEEINEQNIIW